MKNGPVIGLVVVSLLLWAATAPSSTTWGETRLDDIIRALLGVKPKQVDANSVIQSGGVSGGVGAFQIPSNKPGTLPPIPVTPFDPTKKPGPLMGLF